MTTESDGLRIVCLEAENVKRLKAVALKLDGKTGAIVFSGRNGAGKSCAIDLVAYAIGGEKLCPVEPIRTGEDHASCMVDLGELIVTRTWRRREGGKVTSKLEVTNRDGSVYKSPQSMLETLYGPQTFDILAFERAKPAEQRDTLLRITGLTDRLDELTRRRAAIYDDRKANNRDLQAEEGHLARMPVPPDGTPDEPVSVSALVSELQTLRGQVESNRRARDELEARARVADAHAEAIESFQDSIRRVEADLEKLRLQLASACQDHDDAGKAYREKEALVAALVDPDLSAVERKIAESEQINAAVRIRGERETVKKNIAALASNSDDLTSKIEDIDRQKSVLLADANWPIDGLGFGDDGVLLNGVPFEQASQAERLRACLAIGMALNPRLHVLPIKDGSLLDAESMRIVDEVARQRGYQVLIERVDESGKVGIVIEDGEVAAVNQ